MRECEVLGQLMQGHSVRGIAEHSVVAETTVRTQVKSILAKLEVSSQLAAVGLAYRIGWQAPFERPFADRVEALLGLGEPEGQQRLDGVRGPVDLERQLLALGGGVVGQHEVGGVLPARRPADPDPHPVEVAGAERGRGSSAARCGRCRRRRA